MISDHKINRRYIYSERSSFYSDLKNYKSNLPLIVATTGAALWDTGHVFNRQSSDIFGIEYVCSGNVRLVQNNKEYVVSKGEVYLLRQGCNQAYTTGPAGFVSKRFLTLQGMALEPVLRACGLWQIDIIKPQSERVVEQLIKRADILLTKKPAGFALKLSSIAYDLLLELSKSAVSSRPPVINRAIEFMQQNLSRTISSHDISRQVGLSNTHFNRLFFQNMQVSPLRFFIDQRMAWAKHLLVDTALSVKEIAITVGYENPLYFSSQFKKSAGVSPKLFRIQKNKIN